MVWGSKVWVWGSSDWRLSLKCAGGGASGGRRDEERYSFKKCPHLMSEEIKIYRMRLKKRNVRKFKRKVYFKEALISKAK